MKLYKYLKEEIHHHHERKICRNCGNIQTCRCKSEKKDIYVDSCIDCKNN